jgi:hypothetical protein
MTFFFVEREKISYKKEHYPTKLLACTCNVPARKKCPTYSGYPTLGYSAMFLVLITGPIFIGSLIPLTIFFLLRKESVWLKGERKYPFLGGAILVVQK